jgi:hypothetical protein
VGEPKAWPKEQLLKEAYELHRQRKKALALNPRPRPDSAGSGKQSAGANAPAPSLATSRRDSSGTLGDATKQARVHAPAASCVVCVVCRVVCRLIAGGWVFTRVRAGGCGMRRRRWRRHRWRERQRTRASSDRPSYSGSSTK